MANRISINPAPGTWVLRAGGAVLGESDAALELHEADYPPVIYFPRSSIAMALMEKSDLTSVCPFKGDATYFSIQTKSALIKDAGWSYETPLEAANAIAGHIAFFGDKVTIEQI